MRWLIGLLLILHMQTLVFNLNNGELAFNFSIVWQQLE